MTHDEFLARFPHLDVPGGEFGSELTDDERVAYYINDKGEVGEVREYRHLAKQAYRLLDPTTGHIAWSHYRNKKELEAKDQPILDQIQWLMAGLSEYGLEKLRKVVR